MASSVSQEKRANETIRISADFSQVLISGDSLVGANCSVTVANALTDAATTSTILAATSIVNPSIIATVHAGTSGETHVVTFKTGTTTLGLNYETQMNLVITDSPAADNPLISREAVKLHLGITDSSDDRLIEYLLLAGSAYIRRRTGRDFTLTRYEEILQPMPKEDTVKLQLSNYPVRRIENIKVLDLLGNEQWSTSTEADWDYVQEGYVWMVNDAYFFFNWPYQNIVTYRAGFPKIPEDLSLCCAQIVALLYRSIGSEGMSQERIGNYMYMTSGPKDLPKSMRREFSDSQIEGVITRYMKHDLHLVGA